jgi:hypothetical protein
VKEKCCEEFLDHRETDSGKNNELKDLYKQIDIIAEIGSRCVC